MSATVSIPSGAPIEFNASLTLYGNTDNWQGVTGQVNGTTHIVRFDLSALGSDPVIQKVYLQVLTDYGSKDFFYLTAPVSRSSRLKMGSTVTDVRGLKDHMTEDVLKLAIKYNGRFDGVAYKANKTYYSSTEATFNLIVELESEPVLDRRSNGSLSADSIDFGQNITFNIEPFRDNYQHQVIYSVGNYTARSAMLDAGVTSCIFSPPLAWVTELPNSETGTMKVLLDTQKPDNPDDPNTTYTSVGVREYSVQVKVPSNLYPTISDAHFEIINPSTLSQRQVFTGVSRIRITLDSISGSTGASIASIRYRGWGDTVTTNNPTSLTNIVLTTNVVRAAGNITILVDITDSRGRSIGVGYNMGYAIQYTPPSFTLTDCVRCTPEGVSSDRGTAVKASAEFRCDTETISGNAAKAYIYIRPYQGTWSQGFELVNGVERILTETDLGYELSHEVAYEVRFVVQDKAMSVDLYYRLPSLQFALHFANNGRAVGIGRQAEALAAGDNGRLDVNPDWTVTLGNNVYIGSQTLAEYIQNIVSAMQGS